MIERIICRLRGHKLPRRIGPSHPAVSVTARGENWATGWCWPIACERCGRLVGPFDDGYPMIDSQG